MSISYSRWPADFAARYREKGYWVDLPLTDILSRRADCHDIALTEGDCSYRYSELDAASTRLAAALQRRGLRCGDTALVQLGNVAEFYITLFALLKIGVAPVSALPSHQRTELDAYAGQIEPALLIIDRQHTLFTDEHYLRKLQATTPSLRLIVAHHNNDDSLLSLAGLIAETSDTPFIPTPSAADEVALFQLSGGSTGTPKLIPRTHNDYYYSIRRSAEVCRFDAATRYLCALPAAHNYPMSSPGALGTFYAGGCVIMAADPSATHCFPLIEQHQVTVTALVPPAVSLWLEAVQHGNSRSAIQSLQLLQVGGARLSEALAVRIPAELGCRLQQVFGMAEGLVNYTQWDDDEWHNVMTQGKPMCPDDEIRVADAQGRALPAGEVGRLMTRGPYTFRGYYRSPEHNRHCFDAEGFYSTGDLVALTEDGYLCVQGREKDQINRGGEKIAAEEIESLLLQHEAIVHAALVSMDDSLLGEKSCAFIVAHRDIRSVEIRRYLRQLGVAAFKFPDRVEMIDALPLTAVGKVDKKQLRQQLADHLLSR